MNDSMSEMLLVGLSQSEWKSVMHFFADNYIAEDNKDMNIIIKKLTNQIY